jgi:hypothetical protein
MIGHWNEEFLGFDLDNIEEAKERYIRQLDVLNDFESNIEFSEMWSSDKEEIDCDVDRHCLQFFMNEIRVVKSM